MRRDTKHPHQRKYKIVFKNKFETKSVIFADTYEEVEQKLDIIYQEGGKLIIIENNFID